MPATASDPQSEYARRTARTLYQNPLSRLIDAPDPLTCPSCHSIRVPGVTASVRTRTSKVPSGRHANRRARKRRELRAKKYLENVRRVKGSAFVEHLPQPYIVTECWHCRTSTVVQAPPVAVTALETRKKKHPPQKGLSKPRSHNAPLQSNSMATPTLSLSNFLL